MVATDLDMLSIWFRLRVNLYIIEN